MDSHVFSLLIVLMTALTALGATITVDDSGPADYASIQAAIDNALDGDVIIVQPGLYSETVTFNGRRVVLRSTDPNDPAVVETTVIANAASPGVAFDFGEDSNSVLRGFTLTGGGIFCMASSPTILQNVLVDCVGVGIKGEQGAAPTITDNTISACTDEGIYGCGGPIQGNTIEGNRAGIAFCEDLIRQNRIANNGPGGGVYFCGAEIAYNVIVGNSSDTGGGGLYQCSGPIHHNIIAGNRAGTDGGGLHLCSGSIYSNTIVGNVANSSGGGVSLCLVPLHDNIIANNSAASGGGIFSPARNSYNAFWSNAGGNLSGGAAVGVGDAVIKPLFAQEGYWDDMGTSDVADDVWVDGDYHLKSQAGRGDPQSQDWVADDVQSHCIDGGDPNSDWFGELWPNGMRVNLGAYGGTPQASWSLLDAGQLADLNHDGFVGPRDLKLFCQDWLARKVLLAADLDRNGIVDSADFALLGMSWRQGEITPTPPTPDPMTWKTRPFATGTSTIAMVATTATSTDGTGVEYYFEDYDNPQFNSGWLVFDSDEEPRWEDSGLAPQATVRYRVKARNQGNHLETAWSEVASATTQAEDTTAPSPNPATWEEEPHRISASAIRMVATAATDISGVEYEFECTSDPNFNSGWQDSRVYELTDLPHGDYTFRTRSRDKSPTQNTTSYSQSVTADLQPPTPDPMQWDMTPTETNNGGGSFTYYATMSAVEATDDEGGVEYYFQCTTESGFSSGWQSSREYSVLVGRRDQFQRFRVKARDAAGNETGWSSELRSE